MYLQEFRANPVGLGNWNGHGMSAELDRLLDVADDTLNSRKGAHDVFDKLQAPSSLDRVDLHAFIVMRQLVHKAVGDQIQNSAQSWPNEAVTYALLVRWMANAKVEAQLRDPGQRPIGYDIRKDGHRASYRPDWSIAKPWVVYRAGTCCNSFATEAEATKWLEDQ